MNTTLLSALLLALSACSLINHFEVGDAGERVARDAGVDAGSADSGSDAGAAPDAGACATPCMTPRPLCDPMSRTCVECLAPTDCDDDDLCTTDRCTLAGACENILDTTCVSDVTVGTYHSCAWHSRTGVQCWGSNDDGQLGNGRGGLGTMSLTPSMVSGLSDAISVSASASQTCAMRRSGSVSCWGNDELEPVAIGSITDAESISGNCVVRTGGAVSCWYFTAAIPAVPTTVGGLDDAVEISAGGVHSCVRRSGGGLACWGSNLYGQLGDGSTTPSDRPVAVLDISDAEQVSTGGSHTCAVHGGGRVACWGLNGLRQLGDGSTTDSARPVSVPGLTDIAEVRGGEYHTCARRRSGEVLCWGDNASGTLGHGSFDEPKGIVSTGIMDAVRLDARGYHVCARRSNGRVVCWGRNDRGQLGDNTTETSAAPRTVIGL